jgi:hypothetical protein
MPEEGLSKADWVGGWMYLTAIQDVVTKRKISVLPGIEHWSFSL